MHNQTIHSWNQVKSGNWLRRRLRKHWCSGWRCWRPCQAAGFEGCTPCRRPPSEWSGQGTIITQEYKQSKHRFLWKCYWHISVMTHADRQPLHKTVLPGSPESRASSRSCTRTTRSPRAGSWTRTDSCPPTPPSCSCETIWQLQVDKLKVIRCRLYLANSWGISSSLAEVVVMSNNRDMGRKRSHFRPPGIVIAWTMMVVSDAALSRICNIIHCKVENLKVGSQREDH